MVSLHWKAASIAEPVALLRQRWQGVAGATLVAALVLGRAGVHWLRQRCFRLPLRRQKGLRRKLRVAVVGAGIGGSALACWLRDLYGDDLDLTVVSDGPVGGRCQSVIAPDGKLYEGGASIISDVNKYIMGFMRRFGFEEKFFASLDVPLGLYDKEIFFREADPTQAPLGLKRIASLQSMWRLLSRYGVFGLKRLKGLMGHKFSPVFPKLYKALERGESFPTLESLLAVLGPRCQQLTQETATSWLTASKPDGVNVPHNVVHELASAGMRANYGGQTCDDLHAFVGAVSCAGGFSSRCFAIGGGNQQVPKRLLEVARPESLLLGCTARDLQRDRRAPTFGGWKLLVERTGESEKGEACAEAMKGVGSPPQRGALEAQGSFDVVALAHPLARSCIRMDDALQDKVRGGLDFRRCVTHFVWGTLRAHYFSAVDLTAKTPPMAVLTIGGSTAPFYSIGLQLPVDVKKDKEAQKHLDAALRGELAIFKVFAPEVLTGVQLEEIFERIDGKVEVLDWYAYPQYSLLQKLTPLALDEDASLLYLNAIEDVASAMEMSVISARNAANLVVRYVERRRGLDGCF